MNNLERIVFLIRLITRITNACVCKLVDNYGISLDEFLMLVELNELTSRANEGEPTMGQVAKYFSKPANTLTRSIHKLEEKQLIQRQRDPKDGRVYTVRVTEQGKRVVWEVWHQSIKIRLKDLESSIQEDACVQAIYVLNKVASATMQEASELYSVITPLLCTNAQGEKAMDS